MKKKKFKAFIRIANILLCLTYALSLAYGDMKFIQNMPIFVQLIPFFVALAIEIALDERISRKDSEEK